MAEVIFQGDDIRVVSSEVESDTDGVHQLYFFERSDGKDSVGETRWMMIFSLDNGNINSYFDPARLSKNTVALLGAAFVEAIKANSQE